MTSSERRIAFLESSIQRHERWIALADAKAGVVLLAIPASLTICGREIAYFAHQRLDILLSIPSSPSMVGSILFGMLFISTFVVGSLAFCLALQSIAPRLDKSRSTNPGIIYFKDINDFEEQEWDERVTKLSDADLLEQYASQVKVMAKIATQKYVAVHCCYRATLFYLAMLALMLLVIAFS